MARIRGWACTMLAGFFCCLGACEELPTSIEEPAPSSSRAGLCYVVPDSECATGLKDAGSRTCVSARQSCRELWKCPGGPENRSCNDPRGRIDCAYSPDCTDNVQSCSRVGCAALTECRDRIKIERYSFTPNENQCDCNGVDREGPPGCAVAQCPLPHSGPPPVCD